MSRKTKTAAAAATATLLAPREEVSVIQLAAATLKRVDDRREKRYGLEVTLAFRLPEARVDALKASYPGSVTLSEDRADLARLDVALTAAFRRHAYGDAETRGPQGELREPAFRYSAPCDKEDDGGLVLLAHAGRFYFDTWRWESQRKEGYRSHLILSFFLTRSRPGEIEDVTEELAEAIGRANEERLAALLSLGIDKALLVRDELRSVEDARVAADHVAGTLARQADAKARKVVRFKQRLAALVAELEAEQRVQLAEAVEADKAAGAVWTSAEREPRPMSAAEAAGWALAHEVLTNDEEARKRFLPSALGRGLRGLGLEPEGFSREDARKCLGL